MNSKEKVIYKSSFEIKDLLIDKVYTNMLLPVIIVSTGYLIGKIKG